MRENILSFVNGIRELRELYQNDNTFRKCIDEAVVNQMDIQSALIFTMVRGYEVKNDKIKDLGADNHMLKEDVKLLKEQLSDAKWWLVQILNNDENASDFQKYMREEFGEVIK